MALTKVSERCLVCGEAVAPETNAVFVGKVNVTKRGRTAPMSGMSWGGSFVSVPDGKLRIRHLSGGTKGIIHEDCWANLIV